MSTQNRDLAREHMSAFRQRRKNGLQPVIKPWGWLSLAEVQNLAIEAYRVASFELLADLQESRLTVQEKRETFVENLVDMFRDLVRADAVTRAGCWPVNARTADYRNYPKIAAALCASVPADWRPQYPVFQKIVTTSMTGTKTAPAFEGVKDPLMQAFFGQGIASSEQQKKAPASAINTPEAMINADEGNANEHDSRP